MMRVAGYAAVVLATLTALVLLWEFSGAVVIFLISLAIAAAFQPLVENFQQRGLSKGLALFFAYGSAAAAAAALLALAAGPLSVDFQQAGDDVLAYYDLLRAGWQQNENSLFFNLSSQLPASYALYDALTGEHAGDVLQALLGAAQGAGGFLAKLSLALVLSVYWSADRIHFERLWLSLLPAARRARARQVWRAVESGVGASVWREIALSALGGILLWIAYLALGVRYAALLALAAALARLIPWLGILLAAGLPLVAGSTLDATPLATLGGAKIAWAAAAAALFTLAILFFLELKLGDRIFPRRRFSSLLLVLAAIALADSYGLLGVISAPFLAVALQILFRNAFKPYTVTLEGEPEELETKMEIIRQMLAEPGAEHPEESCSLAARLDGLIKKALAWERGD